jgi:hypothetical protein
LQVHFASLSTFDGPILYPELFGLKMVTPFDNFLHRINRLPNHFSDGFGALQLDGATLKCRLLICRPSQCRLIICRPSKCQLIIYRPVKMSTALLLTVKMSTDHFPNIKMLTAHLLMIKMSTDHSLIIKMLTSQLSTSKCQHHLLMYPNLSNLT